MTPVQPVSITHSHNLGQTSVVSPIIIGEKPARPLRPPHSLELGPANDQSVFLMAVDLENLDIWKAFGFVF